VRDLRDKDIRTKMRVRAAGATHGGIPFERGSLFYLLRNRFYIGEVKYKGEILPGEQPAIMDRQLFDAVQQRLTDQWSHRNHAKSKSDHLLTGLLYDDAGHRMIPTHATKAGIRYRYYVSLPHLKGESKTVSVGSVSRIPATDIEDIIVKSVNELVAQHDQPSSSSARAARARPGGGRLRNRTKSLERWTIQNSSQSFDNGLKFKRFPGPSASQMLAGHAGGLFFCFCRARRAVDAGFHDALGAHSKISRPNAARSFVQGPEE
jgi:hypothetical protein